MPSGTSGGRSQFPELAPGAGGAGRAARRDPVWGAYGRCTQLRFLYALLESIRRFPPESGVEWYAVVDDDTYIVPDNLARYLKEGPGADRGHRAPQLVGSADVLHENPDLLFGGLLLVSSAAAEMLAAACERGRRRRADRRRRRRGGRVPRGCLSSLSL